MVETLCDSGAVKLRAGANASTTVTNNATSMTTFINQAEGDIMAETQCDWVAIYSTLSNNYKKVLEGACAAKAALKVIPYNTVGYTGVGEATFMANVLWAEYDRAIKVLSKPEIIFALGGTVKS